jgi:hypothetical protein
MTMKQSRMFAWGIMAIIFLSLWAMCRVPSHDTPSRPETRAERIERQFSSWDGSHRALVRAVKDTMNDPSSFEHVETRYRDDGETIFLRMTFRGKNAFGGMVMNTITAVADTDTGTILSTQ